MSFKARFKSAKSFSLPSQSVKNSTVLELMKKKPYRPSILNGLKEQLEDQFQMSEGHVLEYKELKAQTNIEVPTRAVTITALPHHCSNEMPTAVLRSSPSSPHFFCKQWRFYIELLSGRDAL